MIELPPSTPEVLSAASIMIYIICRLMGLGEPRKLSPRQQADYRLVHGEISVKDHWEMMTALDGGVQKPKIVPLSREERELAR